MKRWFFMTTISFLLVGCGFSSNDYDAPHIDELYLPEGIKQSRQLASPYVYPSDVHPLTEDEADRLIRPPVIQ